MFRLLTFLKFNKRIFFKSAGAKNKKANLTHQAGF
jgi:hypothetical protein